MKYSKTEINWAVIFALLKLHCMVLERLAGLHNKNFEYLCIVTNFVAIPAITVYAFTLLDKLKNYFISYKINLSTLATAREIVRPNLN